MHVVVATVVSPKVHEGKDQASGCVAQGRQVVAVSTVRNIVCLLMLEGR